MDWLGLHDIARALGRAPSTVTRKTGRYGGAVAYLGARAEQAA
jgi:hypothetical protein